MPRSEKGLLAGVHEVAHTLQVSASRAHYLIHNDSDFPPVYDVIRATPVWLQKDIDAYATRRNVRLGRTEEDD